MLSGNSENNEAVERAVDEIEKVPLCHNCITGRHDKLLLLRESLMKS